MVSTDRTLTAPDGTVDERLDSYGYNERGELTSVAYDQPAIGPNSYGAAMRNVTYQLDNAGNRNSVTDNGTPTFYTPNTLNEYYDTANNDEHEISGYSGVTYNYLGDTRLSQVYQGTDLYNVGYDALGRCVKRTINSQVMFYAFDGQRAILEIPPPTAGAQTSTILYGLGADEIIGHGNNGDFQWPMQDRLGSVSAVLDGHGQVTEQYRYDVFGAAEFHGPPGDGNPSGSLVNSDGKTTGINNRFLFTGRELVATFGFYEYRARAYHPTLGRFTSEDPLGFGGGDTNLFRYCVNDPVNGLDPLGENAKMSADGSEIDMSISFWGNSANYAQQFLQYANGRLQTAFASYGVFVNVTSHDYWGAQNSYRIDTAIGAGETYKSFGILDPRGASNGQSNPNGVLGISGDNAFLHEVLHLLGAQDHYNVKTGAIDPGYEKSIMGGPKSQGDEITQGTIDEILNGGGRGVAGKLADYYYVGTSVSDGVAAVISSLNQLAADTNTTGVGVVTVTDSSGSHTELVSIGTGSYSGFNSNAFIAYQYWGGETQSRIPRYSH